MKTTPWMLCSVLLLTLGVASDAFALDVEFRSVEHATVADRGVLYFDDGASLHGSTLNAVYVAFGVTNNDGLDYGDVWVTLEMAADCSPTCVAGLDDSEDGLDQLGALAHTESATSFFFVDITGTSATLVTTGTVRWSPRPTTTSRTTMDAPTWSGRRGRELGRVLQRLRLPRRAGRAGDPG